MKRAPKSAAKLVVLDNSDPISAETQAIQNRIRQRAFELSLSRPHDARELYDWMAAESEIISVPPAELIEKNGVFEVRFAVAGVNPENINVMVTSDPIRCRNWKWLQQSAAKTTDAILAFDLKTGAMKSASQVTPNDVWLLGCLRRPGQPVNPVCPKIWDRISISRLRRFSLH
jgi:hypothetical protein